ncbi:MAG: malonyl-[acyl-carrier protein] O-methyltransferase BioC, partial [Dechloromonas sp.]|nr:malonyl-[acyl-carrier protein] O-methyltransferase BioC [Dechloromonas sp.]
DMEVITLTYDSVDALFAELRAAGSSCAMKARRHGLTPPGRLAAMRQAYERLRSDGRLPATFEVIYGHAWKAPPRQTADGRAIIRFERGR